MCLIHFLCCIIQRVLINVIHWSLPHLCVRGTCIDDVFVSSYALTAKHVTWLNIEIALSCCDISRVILFDPWVFIIPQHLFSCRSKTLPSTCSWCKQIVIFTMMFQQTCSPQISSLGVFTVVDKLFQPARSGVMKFVT